MTRLRGIVKAVVTIAGAVSLSSPLFVSGAEGGAHKGQRSPENNNGHERGVFDTTSLLESAGMPENIVGRISQVREAQCSAQTGRVRT